MIDYGYSTGCVATIVLLFIAPLLVTFVVYLARVNIKLAHIKRTLSLAFPAESQKSEDNDCWDSYLEKLLIRIHNRGTAYNNLVNQKHSNSDKVLHKMSITGGE